MSHRRERPVWGIRSLLPAGIGLALLVTGCATIIHGTRQSISVSSVPTGAQVIVRGVRLAQTPAVIELSRKESNIILRFEKQGYQPAEVALNRSVDGWIAGNVVFGGVVGLAVDFITGAAYRLSPSEVYAVLTQFKVQGVDIDDLSKDGVVVAVDLEELPHH